MPVPGSVLLVRDEEWLVTRTQRSADSAWFIDVQRVSELVRDTSATFSTALDAIEVLDRAKGMDSSRALVSETDVESLPAPFALKGHSDADREDALRRERSLFYVATTRARDELVVLWTGEPSRLLPVMASGDVV